MRYMSPLAIPAGTLVSFPRKSVVRMLQDVAINPDGSLLVSFFDGYRMVTDIDSALLVCDA